MVDSQSTTERPRPSVHPGKPADAPQPPDRFQKTRRCLEAIEFELSTLHERVRSEGHPDEQEQQDIFRRIKQLHGEKKQAHLAIELLESRSFSPQDLSLTCCKADAPSTIPLPDSVQESLHRDRYGEADPRLN